ncbi:MAG TPA: tRNA (N(6)-L-threonylcarbamoyladenosine(37)-C(2))-methylthiotransferase MtaB [Candidatus Acidoferrales bacterium]|jgi:threonylcarbamoyladenosine tRNA methylthiotransferase MtaB|nr:tRNA (N(6)-L-threonylcarbamoyladenosine(37)-C(2))-methylthiotransferase MtaB [Candidatus Acidoferrales bacterium]
MSTFFIEQFGCRATQADGAAIERQLREQGCSPAPNASAADVVVLNTCTVTAAADAQARDAIRKVHSANPAARILVTGCYAQRAPEEIAALPGVSFVVGNSHKPQIPSLVHSISPVSENQFVGAELACPEPDRRTPPARSAQEIFPLDPAPILTGDIFKLTDVLVAPVLGGEGNHTRPTLKIQDGCNSRCSFCVIPFVRGKSRSLPPQTVLSEIQRLADAGFCEIVLSGINLGTYGRDLTPRVEFLDLLRRILDETPVQRLRISSIEPLDVTQDLIAFFASNNRIAPHFHMPLQSASDRILAAMHRWYRAEHYARRVELIHDHLPNAAIGADVITGFPGETPADHAATLDFITARPFTYLHVFSYSLRPGTKAASLPAQLPGHLIKNRARELRSLADSKSAAFRHSQLGRTLRVLTLRRDPADDPHSTPALSENYLQVLLPIPLPPNQFVDATITHVEDKRLLAAPVESLTRTVPGAC